MEGGETPTTGARRPPAASGAAAPAAVSWPPTAASAVTAAAVVFAAMLLHTTITKVKRGTRRVPFVSHKLHNPTVDIYRHFCCLKPTLLCI